MTVITHCCTRFLLLCSLVCTLSACNSESSTQSQEIFPETKDSVSPPIDDTLSTSSSSLSEEKISPEREEIVEKQKEKSPLKNEKCDDILKKYQDAVKKYVDSGDDNALLEIANWAGDPIFEECKKVSTYKIQFEKLDELLME